MTPTSPPGPETNVAVVGAGSVGTSFALVFALAGRNVRLHDPDPARREAAPRTIEARLADLAEFGLTREPAAETLRRIAIEADLADVVEGASYVQECAPENLELKRGVFAELDAVAEPNTILASASSAIPASRFAAELAGRRRCLVVHPGNPPTLIKVAEVVPADFTAPEIVERTMNFLRSCGSAPILVKREVEGFVFNRLQGALLREAYCLVRDGVSSVEDIDRIVRDGLGLRWSVVGPFETVDLNTRGGIASHAEKMGPAYERMGAERGQHDPWTPDLVAKVAAERRGLLPLENWEERVAWRDRMLMGLLAQRRAGRDS
ncbi:MAG: 3-hydroxyacyl-CoA dehydrogenase [Rhizobiales bacterium]|nr:3-hydroxyacyl-CoA dehydrogenase [Hyphomicrobiales bacterium]